MNPNELFLFLFFINVCIGFCVYWYFQSLIPVGLFFCYGMVIAGSCHNLHLSKYEEKHCAYDEYLTSELECKIVPVRDR